MNQTNTQKLYDAFPHLYRGRVKSIQESLMSWGFACGDGWFDLVWTLSQKIEGAAKAAGLQPQSDDWPEAIQVKEKFGTLRFYLKRSSFSMSDEVVKLISDAQSCSAKTCEECGSTLAQPVDHGTLPLCVVHANISPKGNQASSQ